MINPALQYVVQQLDDFLIRRFNLQDTKAILGNLVDDSGAIPAINQDKVILSLINIEQESLKQFAAPRTTAVDQSLNKIVPYNFNLDILVTSSFSNYNEALKFLSESIYFFQSNQVFSSQNAPGLNPDIQKLTFELIKIDYTEMQNIWSAIGANYKPSVLFKVRMLAYRSDEIDQRPAIVSPAPKLD